MYPFDDEEELKSPDINAGQAEGAYVPDPRVAAYFEERAKRRASLEAESKGKNTGRFNQFVQGLLSDGDPGDEIRKIRTADSNRIKDSLNEFDKTEAEKLKVLENRERAKQYLEQKKLAAEAKDQSTKDAIAAKAAENEKDRALKRELARIAKEQSDARLAETNARKSEKSAELSSTQAKQAGLYKMGVLANDQYEKAVSDPKQYDPTELFQPIDNSTSDFLKPLRNDKAIEAQAAQSAWVESFLRDASGAAIPPSERMSYAKDFFPRPGDTPEAIANKKLLREQKMENARIAAGGDTESKGLARHESNVKPYGESDIAKAMKSRNLTREQAIAALDRVAARKSAVGQR